MGVGLQRGSPVQLTLGRDNYEAMIERHGQWVRWRQAVRCPCARLASEQPNPRCGKCGGSGVFYTYQKYSMAQAAGRIETGARVVTLPEWAGRDCEIARIFDSAGRDYTGELDGNFAVMHDDVALGTYLQFVLKKNTCERLGESDAEPVGGGFFRIAELKAGASNIEGVYYGAACDIESIDRLVDAKGEEWEASDFRLNMFMLKEREGLEVSLPLKALGISYIPPFLFVLLNQEVNRNDGGQAIDIQGDAQLSYPYMYHVGEGDILTVLAGGSVIKETVIRQAGAFDVLPSYFVQEVIALVDGAREYEAGRDYFLAGTNKVMWANRAPAAGSVYSARYIAAPTYSVIKSVPQLRTSENQRLPKKALLQLLNVYGEGRGVHKQQSAW